MIFEPVIYQKAGGTDFSDYPIGSVVLSASQNMGSEWLRCDGSYINESTYPELTAFLGKNSPGVTEAVKAGEGIYNGSFSTSCLYGGCVWVYWFQEETLLGFPVSGDPVYEIPVTGNFAFAESPDVPVVLSICGGRVFLCQTVPDLSNVYIYTGIFSMAASSIAMQEVDTSTAVNGPLTDDDLAIIGGGPVYVDKYKEPKIQKIELQYRPEIVHAQDFYNGSTTQDVFLTILYRAYISYYKASSGGSTEKQAIFGFYMPKATDLVGKRVALYAYSATSPVIYNSDRTIYKFNHKLTNELVLINDSQFLSFVKQVYKSSNTSNSNTSLNDPVLVSPLATNTHYIYRAYIKDGEMYIRAGTLNPYTGLTNTEQKINGIALSPYATLFADSLEYISSHNLYVIFVGTGILFSHTPLDMDSWGYLDTTDYFGTITQWGGAEFDVENNTLCLYGRDSFGDYVCGLLRLHEHFDYSNDGAWLPYIASSGVPAWIKALPTPTEA